ncbi:hypothetical protein TWF281_004698 [Arthrobotrys megalospora]
MAANQLTKAPLIIPATPSKVPIILNGQTAEKYFRVPITQCLSGKVSFPRTIRLSFRLRYNAEVEVFAARYPAGCQGGTLNRDEDSGMVWGLAIDSDGGGGNLLDRFVQILIQLDGSAKFEDSLEVLFGVRATGAVDTGAVLGEEGYLEAESLDDFCLAFCSACHGVQREAFV